MTDAARVLDDGPGVVKDPGSPVTLVPPARATAASPLDRGPSAPQHRTAVRKALRAAARELGWPVWLEPAARVGCWTVVHQATTAVAQPRTTQHTSLSLALVCARASLAARSKPAATSTGDVAGQRAPIGLNETKVFDVLSTSWAAQADIAIATGLTTTAVRGALQRLVRDGKVEATGATKARRYRRTTTSPADASAAPAKTPPVRPSTRPRTSPAASPREVPMGGAHSAGEEPSKAAAPAVSARVRKQLEREAAAAELVAELGDAPPPEPDPAPARSAIAELVLHQLELYDEPVTARTIAQAIFRNQHDVAACLRDLNAAGRVTSARSDGITLYAKAGA